MFRALFSRRTLAIASGGTILAAGGGYWFLNSGPAYPLSTKEQRRPPPPWTPPTRDHMLRALKSSGSVKTQGFGNEEFDLLIVGGGATGAGVAVDAASRGLKVALVERDDFAAGTTFFSSQIFYVGRGELWRRLLWSGHSRAPLSRKKRRALAIGPAQSGAC
jgi:glycerol-3-phosphate dehydrogenase